MPSVFQPPSPADPIVCHVDIEVVTPEYLIGESDSETMAADAEDIHDLKEYSRRRFALQTRKNVVSWELNNILREIEDTERYIAKLRRELARLDPSDDSGHTLAHLDFFTKELVEQRKELKELDAKRQTLEVLLQDIFARARVLQERRASLTASASDDAVPS
ncbi:hypothetical protein A1Q1_00699 [Trichosporon asahii var. asahii CBS 2479]|uniref:Uncharacterized protein n=1 Tax=Trichosporon asahii var. asahii (strain ATCC 90039 / CBS 2479 / JCM 2466 / KCTC 7840 / NBRC 103889/ NCYC 2677 / UAMH 7654) TaxID=1186058 RepID=J6FD26_TRIAS|nr:hypothetical protein A1Q1_00699 [Trichosporon asahii var. asahii CBS 2479]EJT52952.1 hypothetical protein A1Q1_00699 [Trichosporon asahii var. asahii CBS 2479]